MQFRFMESSKFISSAVVCGALSLALVGQTSLAQEIEAIGPCIKVTKRVACLPPGGDCASAPADTYSKVNRGSTGDSQIPAFCYRITIENVTASLLTDVVVTDELLDVSGCNFPTNLPPYGSATCYVATSHSETVTNVVWADAINSDTGLGCRDQDYTIVNIRPSDIECTLTASSPDDQDGVADDNHVLLPGDGNNHNVTFDLTVSNTGQADLENVTVTSAALTGLGCTLPAPFNLNIGDTTNIQLCVVAYDCDPTPLDVEVDVTGEVNDNRDDCGYVGCVCGLDETGQPITVSSQCSASVECHMFQGCTPGFWKNNAAKKGANAWQVYTPNQLVGSVFTIPNCVENASSGKKVVVISGKSLVKALAFNPSEEGLNGAAQILVRIATGSLLNAASSCVDFPMSVSEVISEVNAALASCDRPTIIGKSQELDTLNNLHCPVNQQGQCSNP